MEDRLTKPWLRLLDSHRAWVAAAFLGVALHSGGATAKANSSKAIPRKESAKDVSTFPPAASASASAAAAAGKTTSATKTLLPEVAERLLHADQLQTPPYAKLIGTAKHNSTTTDCLRCHGVDVLAKLPESHRATDKRDAWSEASCDRCHLWESSLKRRQSDSPSLEVPTNGYCLACHGDRTIKMEFQVTGPRSLYVDRSTFNSSVHGKVELPCVGCHHIKNYPHDKLTTQNVREVARTIERESCMVCHTRQTKLFQKSVHGKGLFEKGNLDVAGCVDCHGFHTVSNPKSAAFRMGTVDTCGRCHADEKLAKKYDMSSGVMRTYLNDFHGTTVRLTKSQDAGLGSLKPVCFDCHGAHDIKRPDDPESDVIKERLVVTCQKCHPGASTNFPTAWMNHYEPSLKKWPVVYLVDLAYKILIPLVMGQFLIYMLLDLTRWAINRFRKGDRQ